MLQADILEYIHVVPLATMFNQLRVVPRVCGGRDVNGDGELMREANAEMLGCRVNGPGERRVGVPSHVCLCPTLTRRASVAAVYAPPSEKSVATWCP